MATGKRRYGCDEVALIVTVLNDHAEILQLITPSLISSIFITLNRTVMHYLGNTIRLCLRPLSAYHSPNEYFLRLRRSGYRRRTCGHEGGLGGARMGAKTALLTTNLDTIGQMSFNPAIGGVAKGQIVREIDALGGAMGRAIDATGIQFRVLNRSKGPAMHGPRARPTRKPTRPKSIASAKNSRTSACGRRRSMTSSPKKGRRSPASPASASPTAQSTVPRRRPLRGNLHARPDPRWRSATSGGRMGESADPRH